MTNYCYVAVDPNGAERRGSLEVADQFEALRRIKEMGLFPTRVLPEKAERRSQSPSARPRIGLARRSWTIPGWGGSVKPVVIAAFARQLATLVNAGMPLLRGLRTLQEQEENRVMKRILGELIESIENGSSLGEAVAQHPKVFNRLFVSMVKAGELSGALEITLSRLAASLEKTIKIKGKVKAAMFYPCAVLLVATGILAVLMVYVVPRFKLVFDGLLDGASMPAFTLLVFNVSGAIKDHLPASLMLCVGAAILFQLALRTQWGRWTFDKFKLTMPVVGRVFRQAAISRFTRTLGTLVSSGVPILQALTIVRETAGNVIFGNLISLIHENVKQGDPIAPTLKVSAVLPPIVAGMVDVGEQTGALPEMLIKIADNCDEEVDNATNAMTSLLEPIMIVFLAVVVGSIVIAMFLPLIIIVETGVEGHGKDRDAG
jgi:type IV pilus assembly protein PilC